MFVLPAHYILFVLLLLLLLLIFCVLKCFLVLYMLHAIDLSISYISYGNL